MNLRHSWLDVDNSRVLHLTNFHPQAPQDVRRLACLNKLIVFFLTPEKTSTHKKYQSILNRAGFLQSQTLELMKKCRETELSRSNQQRIETYHAASELLLQLKREIEQKHF